MLRILLTINEFGTFYPLPSCLRAHVLFSIFVCCYVKIWATRQLQDKHRNDLWMQCPSQSSTFNVLHIQHCSPSLYCSFAAEKLSRNSLSSFVPLSLRQTNEIRAMKKKKKNSCSTFWWGVFKKVFMVAAYIYIYMTSWVILDFDLQCKIVLLLQHNLIAGLVNMALLDP